LRNISFARVSDIYDKSREISPELQEKIRKLIAKFIDENTILCDIGAGTGRFGRLISSLPVFYISLDIAFEMLMKSRINYSLNYFRNISCIQATSEAIPCRDQSIDIVLTVNFLHLINLSKFAKELNRILKVGGYFIAGFLDTGIDEVRQYYEQIARNLWNRSYGIQKPVNELLYFTKDMQLIMFDELTGTLKVSMQERLKYMREKAYSSMWNIPDKIHDKIMKIVEKNFSSKSASVMQQKFIGYVYKKQN